MKRGACIFILLLLICAGLQAQRTRVRPNEKAGTPTDREKQQAPSANDPERRRALNAIYFEAAIRQAQQNYREAFGLYQQVLKMQPGHHASQYNMARILKDEGKPETALGYAQQALRGDPNNLFYYQLAAQLYTSTGQTAKAIATLEAAQRQFPYDMDLNFELAQLYMSENMLEQGLAVLDEIERRTGMTDVIGRRKVELYMSAKQHEKAISEIKRLIARYPEEGQYYLLLCNTYLQLNKIPEAKQVLEDLIARDPDNEEALFRLAQLYASEDPARSAAYVQRAFGSPRVGMAPKVDYLKQLLGRTSNEELRKQAAQLLSMLVRQYPDAGKVLVLQAQWYAANGQLDSARIYYKKAVAAEPTAQQVWEELLRLEYAQSQYPALQEDSEAALEYYPNTVIINFMNGMAHYMLQNYQAAIPPFQKVEKIGTSDLSLLGQTYALLGEAYYHQASYSQSDAYFDKALEVNPSDPVTMNNYAYFLAERNERLDVARKMIERAVAVEAGNSSYQDTYGWVLYKQGEYAEALKWLEKAYAQGQEADVAEHLGDALYKLGRVEEAVAKWQEATNKLKPGKDYDRVARKVADRKL